MRAQGGLVTADAEAPLRAAGRFVAVTFCIAAAVYLPLLAAERGWIDATVPSGLQIVGILSPALAALLVRLFDEGVDGVRGIFDGLTDWRFGRGWWAVTLVLPPVFAVALAGGAIVLGQAFTPAPLEMASELGVAVVPLILVTLVLSAGEEIGWRGHLLPLLQARWSALRASLVLGAVWAVWHLPVFYAAGIDGWILAVRLLSLPAGAVVYTWLFNTTGGSLLAVTVLHAGTNLWGPLVAPKPTVHPAATVFTGLNVLLAVLLVAGFGAATLTEGPRLPGR